MSNAGQCDAHSVMYECTVMWRMNVQRCDVMSCHVMSCDVV
jgi:hypothetical protein